MPQRKYRRFSYTFFDSFPQSCKLICPHFGKNIPLKLECTILYISTIYLFFASGYFKSKITCGIIWKMDRDSDRL